jgi:hypothetical protein
MKLPRPTAFDKFTDPRGGDRRWSTPAQGALVEIIEEFRALWRCSRRGAVAFTVARGESGRGTAPATPPSLGARYDCGRSS